MNKLLLIGFIGLALPACTNQVTVEQQIELIRAQAEVSTLEVNCPSGCEVKYKDPRDKLHIKQPTNGWDVANKVLDVASSTVPYYAGVELVKAVSDGAGTHSTVNKSSIDRSTFEERTDTIADSYNTNSVRTDSRTNTSTDTDTRTDTTSHSTTSSHNEAANDDS